jgi:ribonuclease J
MAIEVCAVGGFKEVGRNCTAIKVDNDVVILDMGLHMENYVKYTNEEDLKGITAKQLTAAQVIPDMSHISDWLDHVKAIVPSHAHLDHVGAIPFLAQRFDAPIIATPFTIEVIKSLTKDEHLKISNKLIAVPPNGTFKLTPSITVEFIHVTHSTPHTAMVALHTPYGVVLYASDFKFDNSPVLGQQPNYKRLQELQGKVVLMILECLYVDQSGKMPSETVARHLLKEVMLHSKSDSKAMIVTTFSSHIARLKSIIEFGKKLNRKIIFMGRSLNRYVIAAERVGLVNFSQDIGMILYGERARNALQKFSKAKDDYLLVMTGHQGEPKAMLSRLADKEFNFNLTTDDIVVFSAPIIPTPTTLANRKTLEKKLSDQGARLFTGVHVSGHAAREDLHDFIMMVKPQNIIPTHGEPGMLASLAALAHQLGWQNDSVHILFNGQRIKLLGI